MTDEDFGDKNPAAVQLGRKGGVKGGAARDKTLNHDAKSLIAKKGAYTKWGKEWTDDLEAALQRELKKRNSQKR